MRHSDGVSVVKTLVIGGIGLVLGLTQTAMATTYSLTDFTGVSGTAPVTGTLTDVGSSTVNITINATGGLATAAHIGVPAVGPPPSNI